MNIIRQCYITVNVITVYTFIKELPKKVSEFLVAACESL